MFVKSRPRSWFSAVAGALLLAASGTALAGIANTKHNLGSTSAAGNNHVTETAEICVFCHTPHGADTPVGGANAGAAAARPPLWNKSISSAGGYTVYSTATSSTIDGSLANDGVGGGAVGSVSLACLSCHDGTQAMDNIINAPGSGNYSLTGGPNGSSRQGWTWSGAGVNTATGTLSATNVANLSKDLTNDHPIGIQYCGGGPTVAAPTTTCKDVDFAGGASDTGSRLKNGTINSQTVWWVDTAPTVGGAAAPGSTSGARDKHDMILYTRNFVDGTQGPSVECASCHDPHADASTNPAYGATFLRVSNAGSSVCLSCHVK